MPPVKTPPKAPSGLEFGAMLGRAAADCFALRDVLAAGGALVLLTAFAEEVVGPALPPVTFAFENFDPVLALVGEQPVRLSDTLAQARSPDPADPMAVRVDILFETGLIDETADQMALAEAASAAGLEDALEVRAQLALARRRILSAAYLELKVRRAMTEEALRTAYAAEVEAMAAQEAIQLRHILVSSAAEAEAIRAKIVGGIPFDEMAQRQSLDMATRQSGGDLGIFRVSALNPAFAEAAATLRVGEVSAPIKGELGWHLVAIDGRSVAHLPTFEEMRVQLAARIEAGAVADAVAAARAQLPVRMAGDTIASAMATTALPPLGGW